MSKDNSSLVQQFASDDAYFADKSCLSNSMLGLLEESPTKFYLLREGKWSYPSASYFDIGTAVHQMFLEGVDNRVLCETRRGTKNYKALEEANPDKLIMPETDYRLVDNMVDKLHKLDEVKEIMGQSYEAEVPMVMDYKTKNGNTIKIKGKADALATKDGFSTYLVDLKTSAKSLKDWKRNAWYGNYTQQAYMYSELFGVDEFYFVVVEKSFPYEVGIFKATDSFIEKGKQKFEKNIELYERLFIDGEFKPYSAQVGEL